MMSSWASSLIGIGVAVLDAWESKIYVHSNNSCAVSQMPQKEEKLRNTYKESVIPCEVRIVFAGTILTILLL